MVYCFTGTPLAGKSTLSRRFAEQLGAHYMSTGDLARSIGMQDSDMESVRETGTARSVEYAIRSAVEEAVISHRDCVIDGYPRSLPQIEHLKTISNEFRVIFVYVNPVEMYERARERDREDDEQLDVLAGKARSAAALYSEIEHAIPGKYVFYDSRSSVLSDLYDSLEAMA